MKTTLCTLYNSLYLDKGLVLYDSLKENASEFELFVLCMDDKCFEVLSDIGEERLKPIQLKEVENEEMLAAKANRSIAEYCWTCSSRLIKYVLEKYSPCCCTYIDADMYFYHNPQILIDEMLSANKSAMIIPHRFDSYNKELEKKVGTYCVEFNTFKNNDAGHRLLDYWHQMCIKCCSTLNDGIHWGDQKYLEDFPRLFGNYVHICQHKGAGIAPWNMEDYSSFRIDNNVIIYDVTGQSCEVVFYHYQGIKYLSPNEVEIGFKRGQKKLDYESINSLYKPYLKKLNEKQILLRTNYSVNLLVKKHPYKGWDFKSFLKSFKFVNRLLLHIPYFNFAYRINLL